jgi:2-methylcitrate dehydratase PrpD
VQLRNEHGLTADRIEKIELRVAPLVLELTGKRTPRTGLEGKFSVFHSVAVAIIHGAAGEREYSDAVVADPQVTALRERVDATTDKAIREDEAYLTIFLKGGRKLERHVPHALGSLERPMSNADLEAKFLGLCDGVLSTGRAKQALALYWRAEQLPDANALVAASTAG